MYLEDNIKCVLYNYNLKFQLPQGAQKMRSQEALCTLYVKRGGGQKCACARLSHVGTVFGTIHVVGHSAFTAGRTVAVC